MINLKSIQLCYLTLSEVFLQVLRSNRNISSITLNKCSHGNFSWPEYSFIQYIQSQNSTSSGEELISNSMNALEEAVFSELPHVFSQSIPPMLTSLTLSTGIGAINAILPTFLSACPTITHLNLVGGMYHLRQIRSRICSVSPFDKLPADALPRLRYIAASTAKIKALVPNRPVDSVEMFCFDAAMTEDANQHHLTALSKLRQSTAPMGIQTLHLCFSTFDDSLKFEKVHEETYRSFGYQCIKIASQELSTRVEQITRYVSAAD